MRLIMAISKDGFVARGPADPMDWTSPTDKKIFRLFTSIDGDCIVGSTTAKLMPELKGRNVTVISRSKMTIEEYYCSQNPDAWIIGGQILALHGFLHRFIDEVVLCWSEVELVKGQPQLLTGWLYKPSMVTTLNGVRVETYRTADNGIRK